MIPEEYRKYENKVTIACINWHGVWGDKPKNLDKMKTTVRDAAALGAEVIAFPELMLSGYECGEEARRDLQPCAMHARSAETIPGPATDEIAVLAKELGVYVIFGMVEQDSTDSSIRYNSAAIIAPEGLLGRHRKTYMAHYPKYTDNICFKPGNVLPVFETRYGPIGIQICAEFWRFPELSRILYLKGARVIVNVTASAAGPGKVEFMLHSTAARGTDNLVYTASCNHVGKERTISYYGHSTIAGPSFPRMSKIFAEGGNEEEIVIATLNFELLHHIQDSDNIKKYANWEMIAREYQKAVEKISRLPGN